MFRFGQLRRRSLCALSFRNLVTLTLVLMFTCQSGRAQTNIYDWNRVESLDPGSAIWIRTSAGRKYHGELVKVTDATIWFNSDEPRFPGRVWIQRQLPREEVKEVRRYSQAAAGAVGAVIGGGVGVGIGAAIDARTKPNDDPHLAAFVFGMIGAIFGGVLASATTSLAKGKTIYRAPQNAPQDALPPTY